MGPVSGPGMTAPTSINSLVTGRGGDDRFTLVPARRADLIPRDRRLAFASEPELALVTMRLSAVALGADHFTPC
jgi:hypothetical protein